MLFTHIIMRELITLRRNIYIYTPWSRGSIETHAIAILITPQETFRVDLITNKKHLMR